MSRYKVINAYLKAWFAGAWLGIAKSGNDAENAGMKILDTAGANVAARHSHLKIPCGVIGKVDIAVLLVVQNLLGQRLDVARAADLSGGGGGALAGIGNLVQRFHHGVGALGNAVAEHKIAVLGIVHTQVIGRAQALVGHDVAVRRAHHFFFGEQHPPAFGKAWAVLFLDSRGFAAVLGVQNIVVFDHIPV